MWGDCLAHLSAAEKYDSHRHSLILKSLEFAMTVIAANHGKSIMASGFLKRHAFQVLEMTEAIIVFPNMLAISGLPVWNIFRTKWKFLCSKNVYFAHRNALNWQP